MQNEIYDFLTNGGTYTCVDIAIHFSITRFKAYRALRQLAEYVDAVHCKRENESYHGFMLFWYNPNQKKVKEI